MWKFFSKDEFRCKCGCGANLMADDFIGKLDELRRIVGFPLVISSGYRCPAHNKAVSSTGDNGPHTTGRAVDIAVSGERAYEVLHQAMRMNLFSGIGINQKGGSRFIHLDDLDNDTRPWVWSY